MQFLPARTLGISIHAPRTGSDRRPCLGAAGRRDFNPRSPHGERQGGLINEGTERFQSTLPARGATLRILFAFHGRKHFNPRSPHGERLFCDDDRFPDSGFQSTLPARGATYYNAQQTAMPEFQSTLPARGATETAINTGHGSIISIHAPRTGSDQPGLFTSPVISSFQSTLPARGATSTAADDAATSTISIHAPRTGSDLRVALKRRLELLISIHAPRTGSDPARAG